MSADVYAERRAQWAAALRSGEWTQIKGKLRGNVLRGEPANGRCCLGVACEVFRQMTGVGEWRNGISFGVANDSSSSIMPKQVAKWFGCHSGDPIYGSMALGKRNDAGVPFADIADLIEIEAQSLGA